MKKAIIGKKVGMTQIFTEEGKVIPVTVIEAGPCTVVQKKETEKDGYDSVQLGFEDIAEKKLTKAEAGHFKKAGVELKKIIREFRLENSKELNVGDIIKADTFAEGDTFPRPRYASPSRFLELFDMALLAVNETDGILKYMFDFRFDVNYESGYTKRHIRNKPIRDGIIDFFHNKKMVGVKVCETMHKAENYDLPIDYKGGVATFLQNTYFSIAQKLLSENAVPTVYQENTGYPAIIFGENAKYVCEDELKNGAILDVVAAGILKERGIDVGLITSAPWEFHGEFFHADNDGFSSIDSVVKYKAVCSSNAIIESVFIPGNYPASYRFENKNGQRFYVLLSDTYSSEANNFNYFLSYYRQQHLLDAIEWLCKKRIPAICVKNPYLYIQTAKGKDGSMAVGLFNMNFDEIIEPTIILDKNYNEIRFLNCNGVLNGNIVNMNGEIPPYSVAFFEVK